jgi:hypothetical protein
MTTKRIAPGEWKTFFDRFTKEYLRDDLPETVTIEVVSPEAGDQFAASDATLLGVTYDTRSNALEVALEGNDHLVFRPVEIWVVENEADGFIDTIDLVRGDGTKEIVHLRRSGVPVAGARKTR